MTAASPDEGVAITAIELNEAINCRPGLGVATLTLDQTSLTLPSNARAMVNATISPMETYDREVTWISRDPTVAQVRRIGEQVAIVAAPNPGTCTITTAIGNVRQTCAVNVTPGMLPTDWTYHELNTPAIPGSVVVRDGEIHPHRLWPCHDLLVGAGSGPGRLCQQGRHRGY